MQLAIASITVAANSVDSRLSGIMRLLSSVQNLVTSGSKKTRWQRPKCKLETSEQQTTNQWVTSRMLHLLFKYMLENTGTQYTGKINTVPLF